MLKQRESTREDPKNGWEAGIPFSSFASAMTLAMTPDTERLPELSVRESP
jgi:hypothetical protein